MSFPLVWTVVLLAGAGGYISAYFTLVYYQRIPPGAGMVPQVCRLDQRSCTSILGTRQARALGPPNFVLGLVFYGVVLTLALGGWLPALARYLFPIGLVTVALGAYLTYHLLVTLRVPCPLCLASHAINLALTILFASVMRSG